MVFQVRGALVLLLAVFASTLSIVHADSNDWTIDSISRKFNLAGPHGVDTTLAFKVTRKNAAATEFIVPVGTEERAGRMARVSCSVNSEVVKDVPLEKSASGINLKVPVSSSVSAGTVSCQLLRVGRNARSPYPKEIAQLEKQRFLFESETARASTPYQVTGEESSEVILPRGKVELLDDAPQCVVSGNRIACGPYKTPATKEESAVPLRVQYDANFPVPLAKYVEREIEISHWGNVAVEEHFDVYNDGAKLKGEFSRLDHQAHDVPHSFQTLMAVLPYDAYGVYYRDELGNVTTSHLAKVSKKKTTDLELKLRFPMYGGWHIEWYHGYNVPLTTFVSKVQGASDRFLLECDMAHPIEILAERLVLHIVLPPGATNVKIESPTKARIVEEKMLRRYTYLDVPWTARNVLSIELRDVVGEAGSKSVDGRLRIYYTYSDFHVIEKPLTISATLFALLAAFMVYGRISS